MNDVTAHATTSWAAFYTESSLDEKSVTRFLLRITSAHGCQGGGVNASIHVLESKSQQVHKLLSSIF